MYRLLFEDFDLLHPSPRVQVVKGRNAGGGELTDDVFMHWADFRMPGAPTLLIDADVDPLITAAILPGVDTVEIKAPMQAAVTQVIDTVCSRRKLTEDNASPRTLARIAALAIREAKAGHKTLLVSYKPAIEMVGDVDGVDTLHFGALRGLDRYKGHDTVIIAGREQTRAVAAEAVARALFSRDAEPLNLPGEYVTERRRYVTRDGHVRFGPVQVHPDPRVQAIVEQSRECETVQAVARLRLVHRDKPARVFLLSNMATELTVDSFTACSALLPDKVEQAAQESGGIELLTASELARCYPDRWPSINAAKCYLKRRRYGVKIPIDTFRGNDPISPRFVAYRTEEGKHAPGRSPRAAIPQHMTKLEGEAAVVAIVGPLSVIEYDIEDVAQDEARPLSNPASPGNGHSHGGAESDDCKHCGERILRASDGIVFADGTVAHDVCCERAESERKRARADSVCRTGGSSILVSTGRHH